MAFSMTSGMGLIELQETLLYGTLAAIRVTHGWCSSGLKGQKHGRAYQRWHGSLD